MVIALTGAVIVEDNGSSMVYRKKCEWCGYVEGSGTRTSVASYGSIFTSTFFCQKCRKQVDVRIQG